MANETNRQSKKESILQKENIPEGLKKLHRRQQLEKEKKLQQQLRNIWKVAFITIGLIMLAALVNE